MIAVQDVALEDNNHLKVKQLQCYLNGKLAACKGRVTVLAAMFASQNVAVAAAAATVGIIYFQNLKMSFDYCQELM